jgi:hypothetical protein
MEELVQAEGDIAPGQAVVIVHLAQSNNHLFGGTANSLIAREFGVSARTGQAMTPAAQR